MIHAFEIDKPEDLTLEFIKPFLEEKNVILIPRDLSEEASKVIKQWIASVMAEFYEGSVEKMIEEKKYLFQFVIINLLSNKIVLITKNYEEIN
jgi:hypothetical protein